MITLTAYTLAGRLSLTPSVEVGLRHDGGDAETGAGMDVGGGLIVSDMSTGLAVDMRVRMLLVHQAEGFRERGASVSLSYNSTPSTPLGFVALVAPSWDGQAMGGVQGAVGPAGTCERARRARPSCTSSGDSAEDFVKPLKPGGLGGHGGSSCSAIR